MLAWSCVLVVQSLLPFGNWGAIMHFVYNVYNGGQLRKWGSLTHNTSTLMCLIKVSDGKCTDIS